MTKAGALAGFSLALIILSVGLILVAFFRRPRPEKDIEAFHLESVHSAHAPQAPPSDRSRATEFSLDTLYTGTTIGPSHPYASPRTPPRARTSVVERVGAMRQQFRIPTPSSVYIGRSANNYRFDEPPQGEPGGRESLLPSHMTPPVTTPDGRTPRFVEHLGEAEGYENIDLGGDPKCAHDIDEALREVEVERTRATLMGETETPRVRWSRVLSYSGRGFGSYDESSRS